MAKIKVMIGRVGMKGKTVRLGEERPISDALEASGLSLKDSEDVVVNGEETETLNYQLKNGDRVAITRNIQGAK